jgi:RNA-directed DNA polymerase
MKRTGNLFQRIAERDNLRLAFHKALRGKRDRKDARQFALRLDAHLEDMTRLLLVGTFPVGRYRQFIIHDPKERIITAPCFAERVLHHGILNVCEPVFDRWLIADTFACRLGRGRLAALLRARQFARRFPFFLKLDVRKYFDSIPHDGLYERLARRFKDTRLLLMFRRIIGSFRGAAGRGIPIGSLTSQHFANFYLGWFDRFVKEQLGIKGYVRYMDDMVLWSESRARLKDALTAGTDFLRKELRLELKPSPYLNRMEHGMDYLGCRLFRDHMVLARRSRVRFRRKLSQLQQAHAAGLLGGAALQQRATALIAFTRTPGLSSWRYRTAVLQKLAVGGPRARTG